MRMVPGRWTPRFRSRTPRMPSCGARMHAPSAPQTGAWVGEGIHVGGIQGQRRQNEERGTENGDRMALNADRVATMMAQGHARRERFRA